MKVTGAKCYNVLQNNGSMAIRSFLTYTFTSFQVPSYFAWVSDGSSKPLKEDVTDLKNHRECHRGRIQKEWKDNKLV